MSLVVHSFGCKVNTYDSGLIEEGPPLCETVHVINSCAVTQEATREALRRARKIKSREPDSLVVVTGCSAQVDTELLSESPAIDLVVANSHKSQIRRLIEERLQGRDVPRVHKSNIFKNEDLGSGGGLEENHTRSFLKIQDGCNSFCTYCVIPFARGKSRSLPARELLQKIQQLSSNGIMEVNLTGVHIGDYEDHGLVLEDLVELALSTDVVRLRLTSLEPIEVSDRLLKAFGNPRMCPHFHMSIQSGDDRVLKAMKRRYGRREIESALRRIHENVPEAFVGMDVIAGFPGETSEEHRNTLSLLEDLPWTRLHVFPYSSRPGTWASRLEKTPSEEIKKRAFELRELSFHRLRDSASHQVGKIKKVLPFRHKTSSGLSRDYWSVKMEGNRSLGEVSVVIEDFFLESGISAGLVGRVLN